MRRNEGSSKLGQKKYDSALQLARAKKPNLARAFIFLSEAEALGNADATYALATWHLFGHYIPVNLRKAAILLKRAAQRGSADAAFDWAISLEVGKIVPQDKRRAFEFFLIAALRYRRAGTQETMYTFSEAAYEVARCYRYGIGVVADKTLGRIWMTEGHAARSKKPRK